VAAAPCSPACHCLLVLLQVAQTLARTVGVLAGRLQAKCSALLLAVLTRVPLDPQQAAAWQLQEDKPAEAYLEPLFEHELDNMLKCAPASCTPAPAPTPPVQMTDMFQAVLHTLCGAASMPHGLSSTAEMLWTLHAWHGCLNCLRALPGALITAALRCRHCCRPLYRRLLSATWQALVAVVEDLALCRCLPRQTPLRREVTAAGGETGCGRRAGGQPAAAGGVRRAGGQSAAAGGVLGVRGVLYGDQPGACYNRRGLRCWHPRPLPGRAPGTAPTRWPTWGSGLPGVQEVAVLAELLNSLAACVQNGVLSQQAMVQAAGRAKQLLRVLVVG